MSKEKKAGYRATPLVLALAEENRLRANNPTEFK